MAVAAVTGFLGARALFIFEDTVGGLATAPILYPGFSMVTWFVLYRFVLNRSLIRAVIVGVLSPAVACIVFLPLIIVPMLWALALAQYWWITLPAGIGTSLLIQLLASDQTGYRRTPRILAVVVLALVVGMGARPYVAKALRDPLRADATTIRSRLLAAAPLGTSAADVVRSIGTTIPYNHNDSPHYAKTLPVYRDRSGMYPIGKGSVHAILGSYHTLNGRVQVGVAWAFDENDRLIEVIVTKTFPYGTHPGILG